MEPNEKSRRLIEAACAVLHAAPDRSLNAVVLNKALFYLDLASLRDRGETITHNSYIALQNGPVVAKYPQRLIKPLEEQGAGSAVRPKCRATSRRDVARPGATFSIH